MGEEIKGLAKAKSYYLEISLIIILFLVASYLVQKNTSLIEQYINTGISGMLLYITIASLAIIIAPVSASPLIPLASDLWGWKLGAVLNIIGLMIGAFIAFKLARVYGIPIVKRIVSLDKIHKIEERIPDENIFWTVVVLRLLLPVDVLSYALGLFTNMKTRSYLIATLIGVVPFAFLYSYLGSMPISFLIRLLLGVSVVAGIGYLIWRKINSLHQ